jgi:hypothetical protein
MQRSEIRDRSAKTPHYASLHAGYARSSIGGVPGRLPIEAALFAVK